MLDQVKQPHTQLNQNSLYTIHFDHQESNIFLHELTTATLFNCYTTKMRSICVVRLSQCLYTLELLLF